jgi:hypothetical protein
VPMLTSRAHLAAGSALVELHPAKRWRALIELALGCAHDLPTVAAWAREAGMCETQLRLRCRLAGITAKVSLDFVRVLRAALFCESDAAEGYTTTWTSATLGRSDNCARVPGWADRAILRFGIRCHAARDS